jgi:hypothetical protein
MKCFFEFTYPEHIGFAMGIFGLSVGLKVHVFVSCPLGKSSLFIIIENSHKIIKVKQLKKLIACIVI